MKFSWVILFMIVGVGLCSARIYTPCELAKDLYGVIDDNKWDSLVNMIPLLVCVAGYHQYNTVTHHTIFSPPPRYQGIFGILDVDENLMDHNGYNSGEYNLTKEVEVFAHQVLKIGYGDSDFRRHPNLRFYRHICSGSYVETETCSIALNSYVVSAFEVPVPTDPDLLISLRGHHDKLDSFDPFESDFKPPSWHWQMVFAVTTFWVVGIILVGVAAFGYQYIRIKFIRPIVNNM